MERKIWISLSVFLTVCLVLTAIVPTVFADGRAGEDTEEYVELFEEVFRFIQNNYVDEKDPKLLFEGAMKGLFDSLDDPYSYYLSESELKNFNEDLSGVFGGVGIYISKPTEDEKETLPYVKVIAPIEGTPAYRAGISAGDLIVKVDGESTDGLNMEQVVERIKGDPGTLVVLTIQRGKTLEFEVEITRSNIEVPYVKYDMIHEDIGYLKIIRFSARTERQVEEAILSFDENSYRGLIIDLRNNPGGLLSSVVDVSDLFLSNETIVSTRGRLPSENETYIARRGRSVDFDIPIVVILNKGSASASEILAGALRDNYRAVLIGETSFGKGSVQEVRSFGSGGFKITMSKYYTPSGLNIDKVGIEPDLQIAEPLLADESLNDLERLTELSVIKQYVQAEVSPDESSIVEFITRLREEGYILDDRTLRKLIRDEQNRTLNVPPVYDLEYDIVLQEALSLIDSSDYDTFIRER